MIYNPAYHKLETFLLIKALNQSEASRKSFRKICHLWGKGYFAAVGTQTRKGKLYNGLQVVKYDSYRID